MNFAPQPILNALVPSVIKLRTAGHLRTVLQKALPQHVAQRLPGQAVSTQHEAAQTKERSLQIQQPVSIAASGMQESDASMPTAAIATAHPSRRLSQSPQDNSTQRQTNKHARASDHGLDGTIHGNVRTSGNEAMTEATAQRLVAALALHHSTLEQTSQTLAEASRELKDACLLLKGPRHRI